MARVIQVHVTNGHDWLDLLVGVGTALAAIAAVVAILLGVKAGRDLVRDRRQTFELGVLLQVHQIVYRDDPQKNLGNTATSADDARAMLNVLDQNELPLTRTYLEREGAPPAVQLGTEPDRRLEWIDEKRPAALEEIRAAMRARTAVRHRLSHRASVGKHRKCDPSRSTWAPTRRQDRSRGRPLHRLPNPRAHGTTDFLDQRP